MSTQPTADTRATVLGRDRHRCVICETYLRAGQWPGMSIHHRGLRSQGQHGGELHQPSNLISLCGTGTTGCHGWIHAHPAQARAYGWLLQAGDNTTETPVYTRRHGWILLDDDGDWTHCPPPDNMTPHPQPPKGLIE